MSVKISHQGVLDAIKNMDAAQQEMKEALAWMEKNFGALRDTLTGQTRTSWEDFQAELARIKLQLDEQYGVARTTLQRMHARQIDGDLDGGRGLGNLQGS
ncbi:hypothetical protein [Streptomyces atratus]|uniref:Uncharacterized protein n=1 Tax=Streptomyces atratus TaxID=1893 RepID=A0A2Z5JKC9_STRAR|nr:hypothetical protein [Streptomyces atratus]AXE80674.1 hypothetical protein C5746_31055 [Streptomyces atratus]